MNNININTRNCKIVNFKLLDFNYLSIKIKNDLGNIFYLYAHHSSWSFKWNKECGDKLIINGRSNSHKVGLIEKKAIGRKIRRIFSCKSCLNVESDKFVISLNTKGSYFSNLHDSNDTEPIVNLEKDIWTFSLDYNFKIYAIQNDRGYDGCSHLYITNEELERILNL